MVLNHYAMQLAKEYDENGSAARSGNSDKGLLRKLEQLDYYYLPAPKSLGKEWIVENLIPVIESFDISVEDKMRTFTEHCAFEMAVACNKITDGKILVTGGGAYNIFLMEKLRELHKGCILPDKTLIEFKEALIFAFLGVLRVRGEANCLASVTGASKDSCCGSVYAGSTGNIALRGGLF
jgi:anhydro-N-acetylmuramic acid kinase